MEAIQTVDLPEIETDGGATITEAWRIEDVRAADWALMRVAESRAEADEIDAQADAAISRINARREALKTKALRVASFMTFKLTEYAETHRSDLLKGKAKSREFMHGAIRYRKKAEKLVVIDRDALVAWLSAQPVERGLYRMKLEPEMRALSDLLKQSGEIPPGCNVEPESESINVEAIAPERALKE